MNIALLIAALVFLIPMYITPGPNNILCAVHGSQHGFRATLPLISGFVIGWVDWLRKLFCVHVMWRTESSLQCIQHTPQCNTPLVCQLTTHILNALLEQWHMC